MKYYQVRNKIRGHLNYAGFILSVALLTAMVFVGVVVWVVIVATLVSAAAAVMPKTTIGVLILGVIIIACLVAIHHTRGMMP